MHIWKTEELVEELAQKKMSEWDMTKYLLAITILLALIDGSLDFSSFETLWLVNIWYALLYGVGIYYCFTVNRKIDNKDFIIRFTILSWPVGLRWIIAFNIGYF